MFRVKTAIVGLIACLMLLTGVPAAVAAQGGPGAATPAAKNQLVHLKGTISDFNAISLTIKTRGGDVKAVRLTEQTKYFVDGQPVSQRPDFHQGERVRVAAHQEQDGSLTALTVAVGGKSKNGVVRIAGRISDFTASSLTIKTNDGDVRAVQLTGDTKYYVNGKPVSNKPDFEKGERVAVVAHVETDGSLTARRVNIGPSKSNGTVHIAGTILDSNAGSITIKTKGGDVKAASLTEDTKYYVNGKPVAQRPEMEHGQPVRVTAYQEADGSLTALTVFLRTS